MRITITDSEFENIIKALEKWNDLVSLLLNKKAAYESSITDKKKRATINATKAKVNITKNKIENAVNILRFDGSKITVATVAKTAGINYNTAKKYKEFIGSQQQYKSS